MRQTILSATYGLLAGAVAALVLWLMGLVSKRVWAGPEADWYVFLMILIGGGLIAVLRHWHSGAGLSEQINMARNPKDQHHRDAALLALMAIVAVGFGGAVGPEAGILAVVGEMSALITLLIARNNAEQRMIGEVGAAAALGGLYGSPPGGAMIAQEHPEAPKWQLYLAALAGLLGFMLVANQFLPENPLRIHLQPHQAAGDGTDILWAILPAILGAAAGLAFVLILPRVQALLSLTGGMVIQTLVGSALFALLATLFPILRFSGHHELEAMLQWGQSSGMMALLALAALKALALSLCLAAGWRGGAAFPLLFIGAAAGASALWLLPQTPVTAALVSGMAAAITVGLGKPVAAMMIALLLIGPAAMGPLLLGTLIGWGVSKWSPEPALH